MASHDVLGLQVLMDDFFLMNFFEDAYALECEVVYLFFRVEDQHLVMNAGVQQLHLHEIAADPLPRFIESRHSLNPRQSVQNTALDH